MIDYELKELNSVDIDRDIPSTRSRYYSYRHERGKVARKLAEKELLMEQQVIIDEFYNKCNELKTDLSNGFPNLYFSVHPNQKPSGCSISIWIRRDGRDHDGIGSYSIKDVYNLDDEFFKVLERISLELDGKDLNDHFWCKGCDKVHHKDEYGYYYFSSKYCKQYLEKNPAFNKKIRSETYN